MDAYTYKSRYLYSLAAAINIIVLCISIYMLIGKVIGIENFWEWLNAEGYRLKRYRSLSGFLIPLLSLSVSLLFYTKKHYVVASFVLVFMLGAPIGFFAIISILGAIFAVAAGISYIFELRRHPLESGNSEMNTKKCASNTS